MLWRNASTNPQVARVWPAVFCFWLPPFLIGLMMSAMGSALPGSEVDAVAALLFGVAIFGPMTILASVSFLVVVLRYQVAKQLERRLWILSASAGALSMLAILMVLSVIRDHLGKPNWRWVVVIVGMSGLICWIILGGAWWLRWLFGPPTAVCRNCGYDLRASKDRCPECGTEIESLCQVCGYDLRASKDRCPECRTVIGQAA